MVLHCTVPDAITCYGVTTVIQALTSRICQCKACYKSVLRLVRPGLAGQMNAVDRQLAIENVGMMSQQIGVICRLGVVFDLVSSHDSSPCHLGAAIPKEVTA